MRRSANTHILLLSLNTFNTQIVRYKNMYMLYVIYVKGCTVYAFCAYRSYWKKKLQLQRQNRYSRLKFNVLTQWFHRFNVYLRWQTLVLNNSNKKKIIIISVFENRLKHNSRHFTIEVIKWGKKNNKNYWILNALSLFFFSRSVYL